MRKKKTIWSNPEGFSIVDVLAIGFSLAFVISAAVAFFKPEPGLDIMKNYIPLVSIILGGYFVDQSTRRFAERGQKDEQADADSEN